MISSPNPARAATGIPLLEKLISKFSPQPFADSARRQMLPRIYADLTVPYSGDRTLSTALVAAGVTAILQRASGEHEKHVALLESFAAGLSERAEMGEADAKAVFLKTPNERSLAAWVDAKARLAIVLDSPAAEEIAASIGQIRAEFERSATYRNALADACRKLLAVLRKGDASTGPILGLRALALAENLEAGNIRAVEPAKQFLAGLCRERLDLLLIPSNWIDRIAPHGFAWDEDCGIQFS